MTARQALLPLLVFATLLAGAAPPARAETISMEGQIVCSQCWFEADRGSVPYGTASDLACAARCDAAGVPAAIAVRAGDAFELLQLDGAPAGADPWLEIVGRFVRVEGDVEQREGGRVMRAAAVELLDASPWGEVVSPEVAAIPLSWPDLSGRTLSLESLRGRVVVLNFWATWCVPCRKEMPALVELQERYGMLGVQVIGAAADPVDGADKVRKFARATKINFPVLLGADTRQMEALGLGAGLPATAVLDRDGRVIERFVGVFEPEALEAAVERALSDSGPGDAHEAHDHEDPHAEHAHDEAGHVHVVAAVGPQGSLVPS